MVSRHLSVSGPPLSDQTAPHCGLPSLTTDHSSHRNFDPHLRIFLLLTLERGREREKNIDVGNTDHLTPVCAPTRVQTYNLGMCPDQESNPQTFCCTGQCSSQLSHPARAHPFLIIKIPIELKIFGRHPSL